MTIHISQGEAGDAVTVSGTVEIGDADALRAALSDCLNRDADPTVDLSGVEACDTAALQLFYSARRTATRLNRTFRIGAMSAAVAETMEAIGLSPQELMSDPRQ